MDGNNLLKLQKLAFNKALYLTESIDAAEDIASQTIYTYLLKRNFVNIMNLNGWIINTCKNFCKKYFERFKKNRI